MISVLLPVYNSEKYIADAVKSILNQSFHDFELLIINDGSEDNTEQVIKSFNDPRIKYFFKNHSGLSDTLNYGMKLAQNDLIARMDADDIALPHRLITQYNFMLNNPEYDVVSSWYAAFKKKKILYLGKTSEQDHIIKKKLLLFSDICDAATLLKKGVMQENNGYESNNYGKDVFGDYEFWLRIKDKVKFYNIQEVLMLVRYRHDSLSRDKLSEIRNVHYKIQEKYYSDLQGNFSLISSDDRNYYRGAREYFWGSKSIAREYWKKLSYRIIKYPKAVIAYLMSYLSDDKLFIMNEFRIKLRILSLVYFLTPKGGALIKKLNSQLKIYLNRT